MPGSDQDGWKEKGNGATARLTNEQSTPKKLVQFSAGLSKPFIQRPFMTMLLTASIMVFGILTYNRLAVNDLPAVDYPIIRVSASYPGANP
ncbi:hypothetical protein BH18VER2_BH18VER2_09720 [soil metagenome]